MPLKKSGLPKAVPERTNNDILKELLNPLQENALKTVQKVQKQQIEEAMQQGVPPEHILGQLGINTETPDINMGNIDTTAQIPSNSMLPKLMGAKGAFDRGGIEQGEQGNITGIRQPGWMARVGNAGLQAQGITPQGTPEELMKQLLGASQIQQNTQLNNPQASADLVNQAQKLAPPGYQALQTADGKIVYHPKPASQDEALIAMKEEGNQDRLEKAYRDLWTKGISRFSGGIGLQDAKVNQAIDLRTLMNQYYDPKTGDFNVPPAQHTELALGLARLLSPTGVVAQELVSKLQQGTLREKLANTMIYFGKDPSKVGGSTQSVIKMFRDSIDRQGSTAEKLRNTYYDKIKQKAPSRLNKERREAVEAGGVLGNSFDEFLAQSPEKTQPAPSSNTSTQGWTPDKEARYQELLKKRGK